MPTELHKPLPLSEPDLQQYRHTNCSIRRIHVSFLRGRYSEAMKGLDQLREKYRNAGKHQDSALCDLHQAEICLHLNLASEAQRLSERTGKSFRRFGMAHEEAQARAFMGIAYSQKGNYAAALKAFRDSQRILRREPSAYLAASLELFRAQVLFALKRFRQSKSLAESAAEKFAGLNVPSKRALALVLLIRLALENQQTEGVASLVTKLERLIKASRISLQLFPCYSIIAKAAEYCGNLDKAEAFYKLAAEEMEAERTHLHYDQLRIRFFASRQHVYQALLRLSLRHETPESRFTQSFDWCERARSRALVDLLLDNEVRKNRSSLSSVGSVDDLQSCLPANAVVLEYFVARNEVLVFVVSRKQGTVRRHLCSLERVQGLSNMLRLNLDKFLLGEEYVRQYGRSLQETIEHGLDQLYDALIRPVEDLLDAEHLIVVPHDILHYLPFHAFWNDGQHLIDRFTISYAPSASVFRWCITSQPVESGRATIVGVPDDRAPSIADEVNRLFEMIPDARIYYGDRATRETICREVSESNCVHFASHVVFRADQPMNSSLMLADGALTATDLYSMKCRTNLVTLSGCSSGMATLAEADELLGLMRGLLCAGARALMLSLWPVNDRATVLFMKVFYSAWLGGRSKAQALREAACSVREDYTHPYFWAPFFLIGDFQ